MVKFVKNYLFLFIIVIVAFSIRSLGRNWDGGDHLHPDERFLCMVTADLRLPSTFNEYIDPKISGLSPFNHDVSFYVYGGLPITLVKTTAVTLDNVFHPDVKFDSYDGFLTVGRTYSALFDVGTLIVIYFIADKYFSRKTAIFTTLLYSLSVISIQQSNFYTMDSFAAFFMMLTLKFSLDIFYSKKIKGQVINIILTGIFLGMAIGCKFSAVVELALIGFVLFVCFIRSLKNFSFRKFLWMTFKYSLYFFILITATYFIFRLVQPFIFIDSNFLNIQFNQKFITAFNYQYDLGSGATTAPFTIQWFTSTNYLTPFTNLFLWSIGIPASLGIIGGIIVLITGFIKRKVTGVKMKAAPVFMLFYIIIIFAYFGGSFIKYVRYFFPLVPVATIFAGYFLSYCDGFNKRIIKYFALILLIAAELWGFSFLSIYAQPTTRITASKWFYENVPSGKTVAHEVWDDMVPMRVPGVPDKNYPVIDIGMYDDDTDKKIQYLYEQLVKSDYLVLASSRQSGSVGRLPVKYPYSLTYYQLLFNGSLGFTMIHKESSFPSFLGLEFNDESAEESVFIYEHPSIWIFEKKELIPYDQFVTLLKNGK